MMKSVFYSATGSNQLSKMAAATASSREKYNSAIQRWMRLERSFFFFYFLEWIHLEVKSPFSWQKSNLLVLVTANNDQHLLLQMPSFYVMLCVCGCVSMCAQGGVWMYTDSEAFYVDCYSGK